MCDSAEREVGFRQMLVMLFQKFFHQPYLHGFCIKKTYFTVVKYWTCKKRYTAICEITAWNLLLEQSSGCNDFTCIHYIHKFITVSDFVLDAASMVLFSSLGVQKKLWYSPYHVCEVVIGNQLLRTRQAADPTPKFDNHMHSYFIRPCKLFLP